MPLFEPGLPGLICRACGTPGVWTMLSADGQRLWAECPACSYWANEPLPPNWVIWPNPGKGRKGFYGRLGSYEAAIQAYMDTYGEPPRIQAYADIYGEDNCDDITWLIEDVPAECSPQQARAFIRELPSAAGMGASPASDRVAREVAALYEFPMSPERGLNRAQASAAFKKHGLNPSAFGSWVRGGYLVRDGDRRWLTGKGREWADSRAEAQSTAAAAPVLTARFQRAFTMACEVHAAQLRKGTRIPYLAHLMSVAALVLEHGGGEDAAIGGLLHDAVEDSADGTQTERQVRGEFGDHVAGIVMGCSDAVAVPGQPKPPWRDRKAAYLAQLADEDDPDVLLVSACDKLHNARAIVTDLRAIGPALWDRFTQADPAAQLWYYQSLASCYQGRVPPALSDELNRTIQQMQFLGIWIAGGGVPA